MRTALRREMKISSLQQEIAELKIALNHEALFVIVVIVRLITGAGFHANEGRLTICFLISPQQRSFDAIRQRSPIIGIGPQSKRPSQSGVGLSYASFDARKQIGRRLSW